MSRSSSTPRSSVPAQTPAPGQKGPVRRALHVLGSVLMSAAMVGCLAWIAPTALGYQRYVITGGSMSGTFEKGSVAFEKSVPVSQLRVGDVITYLPPAASGVNHLVTHRLHTVSTAAGRTTWTTKGDANPDADPWKFSLAQDTQPVVQFTVPWVGYAFVALANRTVRLALIGGPAGLVALMSLVELVRSLRGPDADEPVASAAPAPGRLTGPKTLPGPVSG